VLQRETQPPDALHSETVIARILRDPAEERSAPCASLAQPDRQAPPAGHGGADGKAHRETLVRRKEHHLARSLGLRVGAGRLEVDAEVGLGGTRVPDDRLDSSLVKVQSAPCNALQAHGIVIEHEGANRSEVGIGGSPGGRPSSRALPLRAAQYCVEADHADALRR